MQNWDIIGRLLSPTDLPDTELSVSHFFVPFLEKINSNSYYLYFSSRDANNKGSIFKTEMNYSDGEFKIGKIHPSPELSFGSLGNFDESGVTGCHIMKISNESYLYYVGWNIGSSVPFRNSIGIAKADKNGLWEKQFKGPILDRSIHDSCFVASNCVIKIGEKYIMYYLSCDKWERDNEKLRHSYNIKIAESQDGINWQPTGKIAIDYSYPNEYAISVPRVIFEDHTYKMWYSFRGGGDSEFYRIGYAESNDGYSWQRKDNQIKFTSTENNWCNTMQCYPFIFDCEDERFMLFNGNDYGKSGIGLAKLSSI